MGLREARAWRAAAVASLVWRAALAYPLAPVRLREARSRREERWEYGWVGVWEYEWVWVGWEGR